jgi:hypothetical protein
MPEKVTTIDDALRVYRERNLGSELLPQIPAGVEIQLGSASMVEDREWIEVTIPSHVGYALGPSLRGHTTLAKGSSSFLAGNRDPQTANGSGDYPVLSRSSPTGHPLSAPSSPTPAQGSGRGDTASIQPRSADQTTTRRTEKTTIEWVVSNPKKIIFPNVCPCCGVVANSSISLGARKGGGTGYHLVTHESISVPYCRECIDHWPREVTKFEAGIFCLLAFFAFAAFVDRSAPLLGWTIVVVFVAWAFVCSQVNERRAKKWMKPACVSKKRAVEMRVPSTFGFASHPYAEAFKKANHLLP